MSLLYFGFALLIVAISWAVALLHHKPLSGPGFIQAPLSAVKRSVPVSQKRQIGTSIYNPDYGNDYLVHISIGTPPQPVDLVLDTGSSELWVNPICSQASTPYQVTECNAYPVYNPDNSSTALDTGSQFSLLYGKGSASGEYLEDGFLIGGANIIDLQFGNATKSQFMTTGIIGVCYGIEIAGYPCVLDQMVDQGMIASRAFALDLGSVDEATGSITFGGIDTMKYTGPLETRRIIPWFDAPDLNTRYWIYMTSVGITPLGATSSTNYTVPPPAYQQAVVLDTGSTISTLPSDLVANMLTSWTGVTDLGNGLYTVDCNQTSFSGTLDFGFGNTVINVPFHEFFYIAGDTCFFGARAEDPTTLFATWILGDTVLRSMYAVFDQDNGNVLLANYVNCGTNIVPTSSGADAVPSITGACTPTSTVSTSSTSTSSSVRVTASSSSSSLKTTTSASFSSQKTSTSSSGVKATSSSSNSNQKTTSTASNSLKSTTSSLFSSSQSTGVKSPSSSILSSTSTKFSSTKVTFTSSSILSSSSSVSSKQSTTSSKLTSSSSVSSSQSTSSKVSSTSSIISTKLSSTSSVKSASSTLVTMTSSSSKISSSVSSASTATKTLGFSYQGCFKDSKTPSLTKLVSNNSMSVELCLEVALEAKPPYPYAGVENKKECWAALTSPAQATPTSGTKACTDTCKGNTLESCGGRSMFNLYYSATTTA